MADDIFTCEGIVGEVESFGQPYHGAIDGGTLTLPNGGTISNVPMTTPNTVLVDFPGLPAFSQPDNAATYGWWFRSSAILFGANRYYDPKGTVQFGNNQHVMRMADGGTYNVSCVPYWMSSPLAKKSDGGEVDVDITASLTARTPGMVADWHSYTVTVGNSYDSVQYEWPSLIYPAPQGDKFLVNLFSSHESYPPAIPEEGDDYLESDPRYWRNLQAVYEITFTGGSSTDAPSSSIAAVLTSGYTEPNEATSDSYNTQLSGAKSFGSNYIAEWTYQVTWGGGFFAKPANGDVCATEEEAIASADTRIGGSPPGNHWYWAAQTWGYATGVSGGIGWSGWVKPDTIEPWMTLQDPPGWYTAGEWINLGTATIGASTIIKGRMYYLSGTGESLANEDSAIPSQGGVAELWTYPVQAQYGLLTLTASTDTYQTNEVTDELNLMSVYNAANEVVTFSFAVTTSEAASGATVPPLTDASEQISGLPAGTMVSFVAIHPGSESTEELYSNTSTKTSTSVFELDSSAASLSYTLVEETVITQTWWARYVGTRTGGRVELGCDKTTVVTTSVNGTPAKRITTTVTNDYSSRLGSSTPTTTVVTETLDAEYADVSQFSAMRSSNNTVALVDSTAKRIYGVVSPGGSTTSFETEAERGYTVKPWASWNPVTNEIAVGNGKCWI